VKAVSYVRVALLLLLSLRSQLSPVGILGFGGGYRGLRCHYPRSFVPLQGLQGLSVPHRKVGRRGGHGLGDMIVGRHGLPDGNLHLGAHLPAIHGPDLVHEVLTVDFGIEMMLLEGSNIVGSFGKD